MNNLTINRRSLLCGMGATGLALAVPALAAAQPLVQVFKDPNCGCCGAWIEIMADAGFEMDVHDAAYDSLKRLKAQSGVSEDMASCHTARVDGYIIEGHVPPADVQRLLSERPDAVGLSVPGMPWGSPGMGPESERDAYSVFLIRIDGTTEIFTHYKAA
ncbi:DUF411 domain-containing protein [Shimia thalassica]|uniref:DUF411 domain-containing protein n=1 Tax=Shimia thalassica TaxID=1715693 RepID=UPI002733188B|nr:DUF411 domain-containing protein [Shimia thalassica]MDP2520613.1 DUF411 domain-containing protein [Shimia thalassica]MDP2582011.1 DUF411 domain-containing protein [Shimia thalassica]